MKTSWIIVFALIAAAVSASLAAVMLLPDAVVPETSNQPEPAAVPDADDQMEPAAVPDADDQMEPAAVPDADDQMEPAAVPDADDQMEPAAVPYSIAMANNSKFKAVDAIVTEKGKIVYTDILPLSNSGGFWYPIPIKKGEGIMVSLAAAMNREVDLSPIPHPYIPDHAYYNVPYAGTCHFMNNGICLGKSHFFVSYDDSSRITGIDFRLGEIIDYDEQPDFLKAFAEKIGFDVEDRGTDVVYAADGGRLNLFTVFLGTEGAPRGTTSSISVGGWTNDVSNWPKLISDPELSEIAKEFTTRNLDLIDHWKCRYFKQADSVMPDDKYINGGIPILVVIVGLCENPWFAGEQPAQYIPLYGHIDRLTGTVMYFAPLGFVVDDWIEKIDLPDKYKIVFD